MKKYFCLGLVCLFTMVLVGCGNKNNALDMSTKEIVDSLYAGISDLPKVESVPLTNDNLSYYLGIDSLDFVEGTASEPLMSSIAHSVVVVKLKDISKVDNVKKQIKEKIDPRKWICVEADSVIIESKDDIIVLIMSSDELAPQIQKNFNKLGKS